MSKKGSEAFLVFLIDKERFSVQTHFIEKVVADKEVFSFPILPSLLSGLISHKREIIPVVNPSFFLNLESPPRNKKFLILNFPPIVFALQADEVVSIVDVEFDRITKHRQNLTKVDENSYRKGIFESGDNTVQIIDVESISRYILDAFNSL